MKYFIMIDPSGDLTPVDSHIIYLQVDNVLIWDKKPYIVIHKMFDPKQNRFIVAVTPNF